MQELSDNAAASPRPHEVSSQCLSHFTSPENDRILSSAYRDQHTAAVSRGLDIATPSRRHTAKIRRSNWVINNG